MTFLFGCLLTDQTEEMMRKRLYKHRVVAAATWRRPFSRPALPDWIFAICFLLVVAPTHGQKYSPNRLGHCRNPAFDREVALYLHFNIPALDVDSLKFGNPDSVLLLDAREKEEFNVSHLPGALHCGFKHFDPAILEGVDKNRPVMVYCSIGYRSEKIARMVRRLGFEKVYNLYGSIFEWTNRGYPLVDAQGNPTDRLHTFNRAWGRWVEKNTCIKVH